MPETKVIYCYFTFEVILITLSIQERMYHNSQMDTPAQGPIILKLSIRQRKHLNRTSYKMNATLGTVG